MHQICENEVFLYLLFTLRPIFRKELWYHLGSLVEVTGGQGCTTTSSIKMGTFGVRSPLKRLYSHDTTLLKVNFNWQGNPIARVIGEKWLWFGCIIRHLRVEVSKGGYFLICSWYYPPILGTMNCMGKIKYSYKWKVYFFNIPVKTNEGISCREPSLYNIITYLNCCLFTYCLVWCGFKGSFNPKSQTDHAATHILAGKAHWVFTNSKCFHCSQDSKILKAMIYILLGPFTFIAQ